MVANAMAIALHIKHENDAINRATEVLVLSAEGNTCKLILSYGNYKNL